VLIPLWGAEKSFILDKNGILQILVVSSVVSHYNFSKMYKAKSLLTYPDQKLRVLNGIFSFLVIFSYVVLGILRISNFFGCYQVDQAQKGPQRAL
jgi:hypothetical protein